MVKRQNLKLKYDYPDEKELINLCLNCRKAKCTTGYCEAFKETKRQLKRRRLNGGRKKF